MNAISIAKFAGEFVDPNHAIEFALPTGIKHFHGRVPITESNSMQINVGGQGACLI